MKQSKGSVRFTARLDAGGESDAWVVLRLPFQVEGAFGKKGRVSVKGTLNGMPFRTSIFPTGDGTHHMMVNKKMQEGAAVHAGSSVEVVMSVDAAPSELALHPEFERALSSDSRARTFFESLPPSAKKAYAFWIATAKKDETKRSRIDAALKRLRQKKRLKD